MFSLSPGYLGLHLEGNSQERGPTLLSTFTCDLDLIRKVSVPCEANRRKYFLSSSRVPGFMLRVLLCGHIWYLVVLWWRNAQGIISYGNSLDRLP